ncbi:MAG: hypothetical protein U1E53_15670 [Dongiaceae bacterium]
MPRLAPSPTRPRRSWRLALPLLLLAGCGEQGYSQGTYADFLDLTDPGPNGFEKVVSSWVGATKDELISAWGRPSRVEWRGNTELLTYSDANVEIFTRPKPTFLYFNTNTLQYPSGNGNMMRMHYNPNCQTTFEVVDDRVAAWSARGPRCVATSY